MVDAKTLTLEEAHQHFAKTLNGDVWDLLQQPKRSKKDDELMIYSAFASGYHWLKVGSGLNYQRAEWLIAHVYTELGQAEPALRHARRCLELTNEYEDLMADFDWAYAYEGLARANALGGKKDEAQKYIQLAQESGEAIKDDENKGIFMDDFNAGEWHGLR